MANAILVAVEDLFFLARIQAVARQVDVPVETVSPARLGAELADRTEKSAVTAVILDLNCRSVSAVDLLRALKAEPSTAAILVLGFVSHVQSDLIAAAHDAGCDTILARSAFTAQLPELLTSLGGTPGLTRPPA